MVHTGHGWIIGPQRGAQHLNYVTCPRAAARQWRAPGGVHPELIAWATDLFTAPVVLTRFVTKPHWALWMVSPSPGCEDDIDYLKGGA